ncbi:MAG: hypothetical protein ACO3A2_08935 [Bdellovibrionia bacterium]
MNPFLSHSVRRDRDSLASWIRARKFTRFWETLTLPLGLVLILASPGCMSTVDPDSVADIRNLRRSSNGAIQGPPQVSAEAFITSGGGFAKGPSPTTSNDPGVSVIASIGEPVAALSVDEGTPSPTQFTLPRSPASVPESSQVTLISGFSSVLTSD